MTQKTYHYRDILYKRKVKFTGAFCGIVAVFAAGAFLFNNANFLYVPVIIVAGYAYWETYGSCSNPQDVTIDDRAITFSGCGKVHTYLWKDIKSFRCKEYYSAKMIFLRVNKTSLTKGRYWIHCGYMNDSDELFKFLCDKEYQLHPNTMKAVARRSNEKKFNERNNVK